MHADEVSQRAQEQDKNTDDAFMIWDAIMSLERDLRLIADSRHLSLDTTVPTLDTMAVEPPESDVGEVSYAMDQPSLLSVNSSLREKDTHYFRKNALVSSPYHTPYEDASKLLQRGNLVGESLSSALYIDASSIQSSPRDSFKRPHVRSNPSLDIIRSPMTRQKNPNKNVFDPSTFTWQPTVLTNRFNERFQTTGDVIEATKVNAIYFSKDD